MDSAVKMELRKRKATKLHELQEAERKKRLFGEASASSHRMPSDSEDVRRCQVLRHILPETVLGFCYWSMLHHLPAAIWFYPLNAMEVTGYEALAAAMLSPMLLAIPFFRKLAARAPLLHAICGASLVTGILSFQAPTLISRLIILSVSVAGANLWLTFNLWHHNSFQRCVAFWGLMLGYLFMLGGRIWFCSVSPAWSDYTTNSVLAGLALIAAVDRMFAAEYDMLEERRERSDGVTTDPQLSWPLVAIGAGSLLYMQAAIFGEVSVVTRWVVTGYPNPGPNPHPYGLFVFVCLFLGLWIGTETNVARSVTWWMFGATGAIALLYLRRFPGYVGGLVLAIYTMSAMPEMFDRLTSCPRAKTFSLAMLFFIIEILFSVWTTAYNFVPGGVYTREHTDWLQVFVMVTIALAICTKREEMATICNKFDKRFFAKIYIWLLLIVTVTMAVSGFIYRMEAAKFRHPVKQEPKQFTAAIWTYHFGYDNNGWPSLDRAVQFLNDSGADVIALLESDASKVYLGNNDLAMMISERLGMNVDFGPSTRDHSWGTLLLSKYPIVRSKHHLLPSPHGELAPAISATVDFSGTMVDFVATHMGCKPDDLDRKLQAIYLSKLNLESENPVVFLGYVTSAPGSRDYKQLTVAGNMKDIDATDRARWCEYILYRELIRVGYARVTHAGLSDTELQMGKFQIPRDPKNFEDNDRISTDPQQVPIQVHFNSEKFGSWHKGHGKFGNKHGFHMNTPKYFLS